MDAVVGDEDVAVDEIEVEYVLQVWAHVEGTFEGAFSREK